MQIKKFIKTTKPESEFDRNLEQEFLSAWDHLVQAINGGLKFTDNFNAAIVTVSDSGAADTEFSVAHTLKRVPIGFLIFNRNKAGVVYDSGTTWTATLLYLKCSTANTTLKVFVF